MTNTYQSSAPDGAKPSYGGEPGSAVGINADRPASPVNAVITELGPFSATLNWAPGSGGSNVMSYWVYNIYTGQGFYVAGNTTSILIQQLAPETNYFYVVFTQGTNASISEHSLNFNFRTPYIPTEPFP